MKIDFSNYINDSLRILILLNAVKDRKSVKMTDAKIKLYDYYLKFPCTMLSDTINADQSQWNLDEYYAFFNWRPDLIRYRQSLNYLIAKGFIQKEFINGSVIYTITTIGESALASIENPYKEKLIKYIEAFIPRVIKLSDSKIEEEIKKKSNILLRLGVI